MTMLLCACQRSLNAIREFTRIDDAPLDQEQTSRAARVSKWIVGTGLFGTLSSGMSIGNIKIVPQWVAGTIAKLSKALRPLTPLMRVPGKLVRENLPSISVCTKAYTCYPNINTREGISAGISEESARFFVQRLVLPAIANCLPARFGKFLKHQVTRVVLSSLLFASAHHQYYDRPDSSLAQMFFFGMLFGGTQELFGGIKGMTYAATAHSIIDATLLNSE